MTLEDRVHALRLRLFRRAEELGNVSAACREAGVSRSAYYQLRQRFRRYGSDGLHPKHRKGPARAASGAGSRGRAADPGRGPGPARLGSAADLGPARDARDPGRPEHGLPRPAPPRPRHRKQRFGLLERHSASRAGLLTERTRRALEKVRPTPSRRHVEAKEPGELVCFDCFFIGRLKGVGKVWQITACDAASSYGLAMLFLGDPRAAVAAEFLDRVVEHFDEAGWP